MSDATMKPLQVGLIGFGTVGKGVFDVLRRNEEEITRRAGRPIRITWIATRTLDRARDGTRGVDGVNLTNDSAVVVRHPEDEHPGRNRVGRSRHDRQSNARPAGP